MMLKINANDAEAVERAAQVLLSGGVAALPTETVYGLATLWSNEEGRARIYALKHRPANKLLQMLAFSLDDAEKAGLQRSKRLDAVARRFCPGPITIVAPANGGASIGVRIPNHGFLLKLLKRLGQPLAATSANLSGRREALNAADAVQWLDGEPDLLVDGGEIQGGAASTVVSLLGEQPTILREGPITLEEILAADAN